LDGIVLSRVIILRGTVLARVLTRILAGVLARLIIAIVAINGWNWTFLATVLAVIDRWNRSGGRGWGRSGTIRFTGLALIRIDNHAGLTWFTGYRRLDNDDIRLFFVLLFAFAVKLGIAAGIAQENEGK
jgi:hypothetical protein